jgi:hypothetical protein
LLYTYESSCNPSTGYCPQPIHVAFDTIFGGTSRIAKRVCFALEVTPDFSRDGGRADVTPCCCGCCQTKNLGYEEKRHHRKTGR